MYTEMKTNKTTKDLQKSPPTQVYHTKDLALAAWLIATEKCQLRDIVCENNGKLTFLLEPHPTKEILVSFYSGKDKVSARKFVEIYQSLKGSQYTINT